MHLYTLEVFSNLQETKACSSPLDADSLNLRSSDITGNPFEVAAARGKSSCSRKGDFSIKQHLSFDQRYIFKDF